MKPYSKVMGAAALIRDEAGNLLIVKPTYRDGWLLPGGMVEPEETSKRNLSARNQRRGGPRA